jgi:hypothetical protein
LALSEFALVILLLHVSRGSAGCAFLVLGVGLVTVAFGLMGGGLLGPAYASIGAACWVVVAAVAAIVVARAHLLPAPPAVTLAVVTTLWMILNPAVLRPDHPVVQAIVAAYLVSWAWVGAALLERGLAPGGVSGK